MPITPELLIFLLGSVAVPTFISILNFVVRGLRNWYYTAGTDFLVAQMTFSFSAAVLSKDMTPYIHNSYMKEAAQAIFIVLGLIILIAWFLTASYVEKEINDSIRAGVPSRRFPQVKLFLSWTAIIIFFAVEVMSFVSP
jgi:hypothetical protein